MKKIIQSQKGSSFVYILVVISILTILTGSLITMTVANYKLGLIKGGRNTAFYFADGAIDEALAEIEEISHRAEIYANNIIQTADDKEDDGETTFKSSLEWKEFERWLEHNQVAESEDVLDGDTEDNDLLTADEASELYSVALNKEFQKQYLLYLMNGEGAGASVDVDYELINDDGDFVSENKMTFKDLSDPVLKESFFTAIDNVKFDPSGTEGFDQLKEDALSIEVVTKYQTSNHAIRVTLKSSGKYNIYNKAVEVAVDMVPPKYNYVTVSTMDRKEMKTNDLLENALTAQNDIIIVGGTVKTEGDVYALGTFPDSTTVTHFEKGGIVTGYDETDDDFLKVDSLLKLDPAVTGSATLEVIGNLKTGASVKPINNGSSIKVSGNIFADSYIVDEGSNNTVTAVGGSMFLMDDLYVKGNNAQIALTEDKTFVTGNPTIDDSLITYLDGVDTEDNGDSKDSYLMSPDLSSAIRVSKGVTGTDIDLDFMYLSGVAYIDVFRTITTDDVDVTKNFQTGESFTTENNFFFYQNELEDQERRTQEVTYKKGDNSFELLEYVEEDGSIKESPKFKVDHFLNSVVEEYDKPEDVRDMDIVPEADKTIMTINSMDTSNSEVTDVNAFNDNYSLGVFLGNEKIYNPNALKIDSSTFISEIKKPSNIKSDLQMNFLGRRDYRKGTRITRLDVDDENTEMLNQYIDFTKGKEFTPINRDGLLMAVTAKNVYINVPTDDIPSSENPTTDYIAYNGDNDIKGVVATTGDVYIYNVSAEPLTFTGSLIAGGSIVFYGSGEKVVDNLDESISLPAPVSEDAIDPEKDGVPIFSRALVYGSVGSNPKLIESFHTDEGRKLIVKKYADTTDYTRSIFFNLALDVVGNAHSFSEKQPSVGTVDINMMSIPQFDGATKEKEIRGYELVYWREI